MVKDYFSSENLTFVYRDWHPPQPSLALPVVLVHGFASSTQINWIDTGWVDFLMRSGRRVIAMDNRGHGESQKIYESSAYDPSCMASDILALMNRLEVPQVDLMGYSMGGRIGAHFASRFLNRVRTLILGGLGLALLKGEESLASTVQMALEVETLDLLRDPVQRLFRRFADQYGNDRRALAACIQGSRRGLSREELQNLSLPILICAGSEDTIAGDPHALAALLPKAKVCIIPMRDHNLTVGDKRYQQAVLDFLSAPLETIDLFRN